jgi:hypothetical protein
MNRRRFIAALGGVVAWPAQGQNRIPKIGVLGMCGGRAMKRTSLPLQRCQFITRLGGATVKSLSPLFVVLAGIFAVAMTASFAETIDATTSCSFAIQAFDSEKRAGQVLAGAPSPHVQEVGDYIMGVMTQIDNQVMHDGKSGIWADFSDQGKHAIAASAVANCRLHAERTIHDAAEAVYRSIRDVHLQLGIVK